MQVIVKRAMAVARGEFYRQAQPAGAFEAGG
jgi:hypothetical protein